ncbi:lysoplasmalogenase [Pedobacter gandavensis]|uniref:lysoplasmalogenase n=1 Tax=Pedobacter gandavensis TaxID=2679963 RepID=UPI0029306472|nr:lysoplasmalogenase [Pedobacter gandavensis]
MLKKYLKFNLLFVLIFILQLLAEFQQNNTLTYFIKPCIVISLMGMLYVGTGLKGRFHKRLFTGLFFCLLGDVLLMLVWQNPSYFMYGLVAFLLGHIFYISAFYLDFRSAQELDKKGARLAIILCAAFSIGFYFYLRPHLGDMKLPVMVYTFVISLMMMMAAFRNKRVNVLSFNLILFGALFFLVSDATLAYNKFVKGFDFAGVLIMATYMIAQYLITMGGVERKLINQD